AQRKSPFCPLKAFCRTREATEDPAQLWLPPGATAELSCNISGSPWGANWYREKPDGSLEWIYQSSETSKPKGRYSGTVRALGFFSFNISDVQREDSGSYYCTSSVSHSHFGDGTRLLVTGERDATEPKLSILVPVDAEEPSDVVPLLCHLHDLPRGWDTVRWHHGRDTPATAEAVDERGPGSSSLSSQGRSGNPFSPSLWAPHALKRCERCPGHIAPRCGRFSPPPFPRPPRCCAQALDQSPVPAL
uniref:Ig-like domain-containing protein n=1 Tax=Anser cygnoides TaxID=8845 RepID=A0A8B9D9H6_ANSCY